jgi:hypothetical protein
LSGDIEVKQGKSRVAVRPRYLYPYRCTTLSVVCAREYLLTEPISFPDQFMLTLI